jgi:hypothetical protein
VTGLCEQGNELSGSMKTGTFLNQLGDCWLLKNDSVELVTYHDDKYYLSIRNDFRHHRMGVAWTSISYEGVSRSFQLAAWSENCKWYISLPLGVVSLFCESV